MSYTDDTVYRLREIIDEYTDIAITYRNEEDRKEQLMSLLENNNLPTPEIELTVANINDDAELTAKLEECRYDYRKKKRALCKIQQENAALEHYLNKQNIKTDNLFISLDTLSTSP